MTWAVSRECNAEDETNRVNLQSHGEFQADIDFYTYSNIINNLTCSMFLIYREKSGISSGRLGYGNVSQTKDSEEWRGMI